MVKPGQCRFPGLIGAKESGLPPPDKSPNKSPARDDGASKEAARLFEEAMSRLGDVQPLRGPARLVAGPAPLPSAAVRARREAATKSPAATVQGEATSPVASLTAVGRAGEAFAFVADGVDRSTIRALEDGSRPPEVTLDLHGQKAAAAEARLTAFVRAAQQQGRRVIHVVHGRGLGSKEAGPVLRNLVLSSLSRGPLAALVLAVVSAPARLGGSGAAIILLRRTSRVADR